MAARPVYMMLFENMDDYYLARDFAFQESLDFMEGDVAGYSTLIFFAESGEIIAFCDNLGWNIRCTLHCSSKSVCHVFFVIFVLFID